MSKIYIPALLMFLAFVSISTEPAYAGNNLPLITRQPVSVSVECTGDSVTFIVEATGNNLTYQWYQDGRTINGATQPSYTIDPVTTSHIGLYYVIVREPSTATMERSSNADLEITRSPVLKQRAAPEIVTCGEQPVTFFVTATGANLTYQWYRNGEPIFGQTESSYTINQATPADTVGAYRVVIAGACGDSITTSFRLRFTEPVRLLYWSESKVVKPGSIVTCDVSFSAKATGAGLRYRWFKDDVPLVGIPNRIIIKGDSIFINNVVPADAGLYSLEVSNNCSRQTTGGMRLTIAYVSGPAPHSVCSGEFVRLVAPDTTDEFTYQWKKEGAIIPGATSYALEFPSVQVADQGNYSIDLTLKTTSAVFPTPPGRLKVTQSTEFTSEPESQTLCHGESLTLRSSAIGDSLSYQWWKNGLLIPGATGPSFEVPSAVDTNSGYYNVQVTGSCGQILSDEAHVLVAAPTIISQQPLGRTIKKGESITFFVTATGTNLKYQWRRNGEDMLGYNDTFITIATAVPENAATYDVVITDACNEVHVSDPAVLVVDESAAIKGDISSAEKGRISVWPHPASGITRLEIRLPKNQQRAGGGILSLYDTRGDHALDIDIEQTNGPTATATFDASKLSPGIYHLRLNRSGVSQPLGSIVVE